MFADDGRVVLVEADWDTNRSRIVVLDKTGTPVDGWPWTPEPTGDPGVVAAFGPEDSLYAAVRGSTASFPLVWTWTLHRLDSRGRELPGFPVNLPSVSFCDLQISSADFALVTCEEENQATGAYTTVAMAVRPDGSLATGWPIRLAGSGGGVALAAEGTVFIGTQTETGSSLTAVAADGSTVAGWPRAVQSGSATIDRRGRVRITHHDWSEGQCAPATRTVYSMLEPDGRPSGGWPITLQGWASEPEIAEDGTMYVVTDAGRAIAYSAAGMVMDGWPVSKVGVTVACADGSGVWSADGDGVVTVGDGRATLISPNGRVPAGWPVALPYTLAPGCLYCVPGPAAPIAPAIGEAGIYVAAYDGVLKPGTSDVFANLPVPRIVAIDRAGSLPGDWQQSIGKAGDEIRWVQIAPTGRVWALIVGGEGDGAVLHLVAEDAVPGS